MKLLEKRADDWALTALVEGPGLLRLDNGVDLAASPPDLPGIDVVRLDWPAFKFGQAFTQARLLRERYGFAGQVRAGGALFRDQALFAYRCGVDAFEVADEETAKGYRESLSAYTDFYQPAARGAAAWARRHPA